MQIRLQCGWLRMPKAHHVMRAAARPGPTQTQTMEQPKPESAWKLWHSEIGHIDTRSAED